MKQKSEFDARRYVQLFMAGYVPRSKDEKKFVDKHVAQLHQDVNGNKDDVFKATNIPTHKRPPYHGYQKGQDERMYESVNEESAPKHILDKAKKLSAKHKAGQHVNKTDSGYEISDWYDSDKTVASYENGKLKEHVEHIQEVSKWKLLSYINRATNDLRSKSFKAGLDPYDHPGTPVGDAFQRNSQKRDKRQIGIGKAASKLAFGKVSENAEQIDEMNKSALSDKDLYHPKSIMRVKGYNKMNEPIQSAQIQMGTNIVSEHEGEGGHVAQVRYSDVRKEYQVHHYTNGYNLGEHPISYHDTKKDAVDTAKYTTTVRNHDYLDRHEVLAGRVGKGSAYGVEPKSTDEILRSRGVSEELVNEEMSDAQMESYKVGKEQYDKHTDTVWHVVTHKGKEIGTIGTIAKDHVDKHGKWGYESVHGIGGPNSKLNSKDQALNALIKTHKEKTSISEEMSDAQMAKRERIVKSMKKKAGTFEKRYGDKAKDVMYATATKMAMEDLNYVNLEMTDSIAQLLEADELDKNKEANLKGIETQAKKVREVIKKYPIAPRVESVIEQILGVIGQADQIDIEFNSGEVVQIAAELAESILNVFMDLTEENQVKFEELISEDLVGFEDGLSFIAEAFEGMQ